MTPSNNTQNGEAEANNRLEELARKCLALQQRLRIRVEKNALEQVIPLFRRDFRSVLEKIQTSESGADTIVRIHRIAKQITEDLQPYTSTRGTVCLYNGSGLLRTKQECNPDVVDEHYAEIFPCAVNRNGSGVTREQIRAILRHIRQIQLFIETIITE